MNRNKYCCQRCGNLKYNWSEDLCPECLEKDRLRRECKKYFGMSIKMREATKEEKQGVNEYIQSISEKVYTKDEVIDMLEELKKEIIELPFPQREPEYMIGYNDCKEDILCYAIQEKINELKEN